MYAVIPSFALVGPLALLAMLFPGVFAALSYAWKQWRAFGVAASSVSTLSLLHWLVRGSLPNRVEFGSFGLQLLLLMLVLAALIWAKLRYRTPKSNPTPILGRGVAYMTLLTLIALFVLGIVGFAEPLVIVVGPLFASIWIAVGFCVGLIHALCHRMIKNRGPLFSSEFLALLTMFATGVAVTWSQMPARHMPEKIKHNSTTYLIHSELIWESSEWTEVLSPLEEVDGSFYFGVGRQSAFQHQGGIVCINSQGSEQWQFDAEGTMRPVFAKPTFSKGKLFVGEGLHEDEACRLFQLDAATGNNARTLVTTTSHIEESPTIKDGTIYFAAGADGVYAVRSDRVLWHVDPGWHSDTALTLHKGKIYGGSGYERRELFALDAETGTVVWRQAIDLRSFGKPLIVGENVVYGLGSGNLGKDQIDGDDVTQQGRLLCLNATTGDEVWRCDLSGAVHTPLLLEDSRIYATSRNGKVFCIDARSGNQLWEHSLSTTVTAGPMLLNDNLGVSHLIVLTQQGEVYDLSWAEGYALWFGGLAQGDDTIIEVYSTPSVVGEASDALVIGGRLRNRYNNEAYAVVFRLKVRRR